MQQICATNNYFSVPTTTSRAITLNKSKQKKPHIFSDVVVTLVAVGCNEDKAEHLYLLQTKLLSLEVNEINTSKYIVTGDAGMRTTVYYLCSTM